ncbi:MAG: DUF885 family protein [Gammaproteobacteria bacterium]
MSTKSVRLLLSAFVLVTALTACQKEEAVNSTTGVTPEMAKAAPVVVDEAETKRLNAWFDERYEESLQFSPAMLTVLGRKEKYAEFDQVGEAAARERLAWRVATVEQMRAKFDYDSLTPIGKESYDLWVFETEEAKADMEFLSHGYLFGELGGPEAQFATFLINFHKVDTQEDMQAYNKRISEVARAMNQITDAGRIAAEKGIRPPQFAFDTAIERATKVITGLPFNGEDDSPLLADAKRKVQALSDAGDINKEQAATLLANTSRALTEDFKPAYVTYIEWLNAEKPNASEVARGVSALPNGEAYYNHQLAGYTTLPMTADDVHKLGLSEVARIKGEMEEIKEQLEFTGDLSEFFDFIRTDSQFYFPNTDEGREEYLSKTRDFLAEIDKKLPEFFGRLPKAGLEVKRVEAFREVDGGAQHYSSGTPDGSRNGVYYVHMSDMSAYSKTDMETVAYHEASPGHHMQISIAQELTDVPTFRTQAHFSVYSEGWALYTEKLAKEMGQFKDPYMDFGRLTAEMWRAIRLVVDTGLHTKGWSQEQAVQYFFDNSAIPEGAVRSEVRRYITTPGQATSYKIGMLKIEELRARAESELGDGFDIRGFHDVVLGGGALPLPLLESRVNAWITAQKG